MQRFGFGGFLELLLGYHQSSSFKNRWKRPIADGRRTRTRADILVWNSRRPRLLARYLTPAIQLPPPSLDYNRRPLLKHEISDDFSFLHLLSFVAAARRRPLVAGRTFDRLNAGPQVMLGGGTSADYY